MRSIDQAVTRVDGPHALTPGGENDAFLLQVVGVVDDPFGGALI
ncbi:MAG: hypothetical protein AB8B60_14175 [Sulfitobacter sp.]